MNFFGHAALASSHFGDLRAPPPATELSTLCAGAMLPDFIGMLRLGRPAINSAALARGVAFHHRTDAAFHELGSFLQMSRAAFAWLSARSLARGPARAVAHIGIEMLLDEVLARDAAAREQYRAALRLQLGPLLTFPLVSDAERLASLQGALLDRADGLLQPAPELMAARIARALAGRPRLATDAAGEQVLIEWVTLSRPLVAAEAPGLFASLRQQLAPFGRDE